MDRVTPMFQQYLEIKEKYKDSILFYRMGDFYEMFFEDAQVASKILDIALTSRDRDKDSGVPMCGVPYHSAATYIAKLVQQGHKVAICEQVEDPREARGLVKRQVVRVVTPGLVVDPDGLVSEENNYLMGVCPMGDMYGVAILDVSTGEFRLTELSGEKTLLSEGERIRPKELLLPEGSGQREDLAACLRQWSPTLVTYRAASEFSRQHAFSLLCHHFGVRSLEGFGCGGMSAGIMAAGAVLSYAKETQGEELPHVRALRPYLLGDHMVLDEWTRRNLELFENLQDRSRKNTLLEVLDRTMTPMGARALRRWLGYPLLDPQSIGQRLESVEELFRQNGLREMLRKALGGIQDLERLAGRISLGVANARDLVSLKDSLKVLPALKETLGGARSSILAQAGESLDILEDVVQWVESTLVENPPLSPKEGGLIRQGVHPELDEWIRIGKDGKKYIAAMEEKERHRTGIPGLRIGYNRVFGYYLEVTKSQSRLVPPDYIRKQTLVNAERYVNEELKEYELKVLEAEQKRAALEQQLFEELRERVASQVHRIQQTASQLAQLDCLSGLAQVALENRYVRPRIEETRSLRIREGRHPVVEKISTGERFVPNDLELDGDSFHMMVLTGPNMAGKSTYLRQVALIVLMAQAGSFVPASEASIGVVDRIFTRVGASDNLARGQSTFMVEMTETAQILNSASPRSLIILDEVGRGTGTRDGLSIAWAVAEYILDNPRLRSRTLFATHYHELTELALTKERVRNFHMAVKEWDEKVIFLRRVVEGGTNRSYGIQVARLAGLPPEVLERAREILANLEKQELDELGRPRLARTRSRLRSSRVDPRQISLFGGAPAGDGGIGEELRKLDVDTLTPLEALNLIHKWKRIFQ